MPLLETNQNAHEAGDKPAFRVHTANTKLTKSELEAFNQVAKAAAMKPAELLRAMILKAIEDAAGATNTDPIFTEIIGLRMMVASLLRPVCTGETIKREVYEELLQLVHKEKPARATAIAKNYREKGAE